MVRQNCIKVIGLVTEPLVLKHYIKYMTRKTRTRKSTNLKL